MPYATASEVCDFLGWPKTTAKLEQVAVLLPVIEEEVEAFIGASLLTENMTTKIFSGGGTDMLTTGFFMRNLYTVNQVNLNGLVVGNMYGVSMQPSSPRNGVYRWLQFGDYSYDNTNIFPLGNNNIAVTADWGFTVIPQKIKLAIAYAVKYMSDMRDINFTISRESGQGREVFYRDVSDFECLPPISMKYLMSFSNRRWMVE